MSAVNIAAARRVIAVIKPGLVSGIDDGEVKPGHMCVEAAVAYAMGESHNDHPKCVHPDVAGYKIGINDDGNFASDKQRAKKLVRIAVAQLGSKKMAGEFQKELDLAFNLAVARRERVSENSVLVNTVLDAVIQKLTSGDTDGAETLAEEASNNIVGFAFTFESGVGSFRAISELETDGAIAIGIEALRRAGSPGVKLMDQLIKSGEL